MSYIFTKKQFEELEKRIKAAQKELARVSKEKGALASGQDGWHDEGFRLAFVEEERLRKRLADLKSLIPNAKIVEPKEQNQKVDIGNRVIIEYKDGFKETLVLNGYIVNAPENHFSIYSPLGKALKGAKKGQTKTVKIQGRKQKIKILEILFPSKT